MRGPRLPGGPLGGHRGRRPLPGEHVLQPQRHVQRGHARLVRQQPAHRRPALAGRRELRPVGGDRGVQVELPPLGEQQRGGRRQALGDRAQHLRGVGRPRHSRCGPAAHLRPGVAAPQVDHLPAPDVQRERRAELAVVPEVAGEGLPHRLEAPGRLAPDLHHRAPSPSSSVVRTSIVRVSVNRPETLTCRS